MVKRSRIQSLKETIFGVPTEVSIQQGNAVLGRIEQVQVSPQESYKDQVDLFLYDPVVRESIQQFSEQVSSTGIFTTMNDEYTLRLPDGNKGDHNAKEAIDEWNRRNDVDTKILQIAIELAAFGNSVWIITDTGGFVNVPIQGIFKAIPRSKEISIRDEYDLMTTATYGSKPIKWGTFKHFRINLTGEAPFGRGICAGLVAIPDADTPSIYDIRKSVRTSMKKGFEKFSFGNELWSFEGMSDDKITEIGTDIANMADTGNRIATNVKGDIKLSVPQRTQSYDKWLEVINNEFLMSLANPSLKLGLEQGFTKATAETAREMFEAKIAAMRRIIKREIESLWDKVLTELGFDPIRAEVKLHFGSPEVEYATPDVFAAVDKGILTKDEARKILREYMGWRLEGDLPKEVKVPEVPKVIESLTETKPSKQEVDINVNVKHDSIAAEVKTIQDKGIEIIKGSIEDTSSKINETILQSKIDNKTKLDEQVKYLEKYITQRTEKEHDPRLDSVIEDLKELKSSIKDKKDKTSKTEIEKIKLMKSIMERLGIKGEKVN